MIQPDTYYDDIAEGYDELHKEEQLKKLSLIKENIDVKPEDSLLDVGCGTGISTTFWGCRATGIDPSEGLLKQADSSKAEFIKAKAEAIPFDDDVFDWITAITSIHNFEDIKKGLEEIKRTGKKNFVLTILKKSPKKEEILELIKQMFKVEKQLEEDKDLILICEK